MKMLQIIPVGNYREFTVYNQMGLEQSIFTLQIVRPHVTYFYFFDMYVDCGDSKSNLSKVGNEIISHHLYLVSLNQRINNFFPSSKI